MLKKEERVETPKNTKEICQNCKQPSRTRHPLYCPEFKEFKKRKDGVDCSYFERR
jgi:hypothetical protein